MLKLVKILWLISVAFAAKNFDDNFNKKKQGVKEKHSLKIQDPYDEKQARFDSYFSKPKNGKMAETAKECSLEKLEKAYDAMSMKRKRFEAYFTKEQQTAQRWNAWKMPNEPIASRKNVSRKNDLNVRALFADFKREVQRLDFSSDFGIKHQHSANSTKEVESLLFACIDENLDNTKLSFGGTDYVREEQGVSEENEQRFLEILKQKQGQATQIDDAVKEIFPEDAYSHLPKIHDWVRMYEQHNPEVRGLEIEYYL